LELGPQIGLQIGIGLRKLHDFDIAFNLDVWRIFYGLGHLDLRIIEDRLLFSFVTGFLDAYDL